MKYSYQILMAFALVPTFAVHAETIKGTVTVPPAEKSAAAEKPDDKSTPAAAQQKSAGVVVWVENVKDAKPPADKQTLAQKDGQFNPPLIVAVAGQTVTFPNDDNIAHNVFSMSAAKKFNLGIYPKGESKEVVFEKAGIIDVFCSLHRQMHAKIVVVPSVHYAVCAANGSFEIKDVPPGDYKVTAWSDSCNPTTMDVKVAANADASAAFTLTAAAKQQAATDTKGKDSASAESK